MSSLTPVENTLRLVCDQRKIQSILREIKRSHGLAEAAITGKPPSLVRSLNRRRESRVPLQVPIYIRPALRFGRQVKMMAETPIMGVTRDLCTNGIGFSFDQPIRSRHMTLEFDLFNSEAVELLVDVHWQRQKNFHAYTAGGTVVGIVTSQLSDEL